MERFHNRVLQVAFSLPGRGPPQKEISDDELIDILMKMAQAQEKVDETIRAMEGKVKEAQQQKEELIEKSNLLNSQVLQLLVSVLFLQDVLCKEV